MANNLHLFYIDSAVSKAVPSETRTEDGVLPEQRFVGLHTLMCHAEREKTLSRASVMPGAVVLAVQHLKNIEFDIYIFFNVSFSIFIGQNFVNVQYFVMLNILYCNPFACFEAGLVSNCVYLCLYDAHFAVKV